MRRRLATTCAAALLLTLIVSMAWYWPLLVSLSKPTALSLLPAPVRAQVMHTNQATKQEGFSYPRLGIVAPAQVLQGVSPYRYEDWGQLTQALRQGLGVTYEGSSLDTATRIYITGHSSDSYPHRYSSIFAGLGQVRIDDTFTLTQKGSTTEYRVITKKAVDPTQVYAYVQAYPSKAEIQQAILVTCWVPLTTTQRLVIIAEKLR